MTYTEKVSISGTALSFLLYECLNSSGSQEGFLLGEVTSEITNHISDSHSENARLDTQIIVRAVLPLPMVSIFYSPIGKIKEDVLSDLLLEHSSEVVGWYKYRLDSIKPTFRDKRVSKNLQNYFEKRHGKLNFATCHVTTRSSAGASTHTFIYRFSKINRFNMYEYIEDVTANLGEKHTGYQKGLPSSPHSIFNKIVQECSVMSDGSSEAILNIQQAVGDRLVKEAQIAANTECTIRKLEAEIQEMTKILTDKQTAQLKECCDKMNKDKLNERNKEMVQVCENAYKPEVGADILGSCNILMHMGNDNKLCIQFPKSPETPEDKSDTQSECPVMKPLELNYSRALKKKDRVTEKPSSSNQENCCENMIKTSEEEQEVQNPKVSSRNSDN